MGCGTRTRTQIVSKYLRYRKLREHGNLPRCTGAAFLRHQVSVLASLDPELMTVIEAWSTLPEHTKKTIEHLFRSPARASRKRHSCRMHFCFACPSSPVLQSKELKSEMNVNLRIEVPPTLNYSSKNEPSRLAFRWSRSYFKPSPSDWRNPKRPTVQSTLKNFLCGFASGQIAFQSLIMQSTTAVTRYYAGRGE